MTRTTLLAFGFLAVIGIGLLAPLQGQAQILPFCEKTVYIISPGKASEPGTFVLPGPPLKPEDWHPTHPGAVVVFPDQYDKNKHGEVVGLTTNTQCGFNDFLRLFINIANWAMGVLAALATLLFLWGGFNLLISGGRAEKVQEGKRILTGTIIGILVIFTAWIVVGFWVAVTTGDPDGTLFARYPDFLRPWHGGQERTQRCRRSPEYPPGCDRNDLHRGCGDGRNAQAGPITQAQQLLDQWRCNPGPADGCFGPQTEAAVTLFQEVNGIEEAPPLPLVGHIGPATWLELENPNANCEGNIP